MATQLQGDAPADVQQPVAVVEEADALPETIDFTLGAQDSEVATLVSSDGHRFLVNAAALGHLSPVFRAMIEDVSNPGEPPVLEEKATVLYVMLRAGLLPEEPPFELPSGRLLTQDALDALRASNKYLAILPNRTLQLHAL